MNKYFITFLFVFAQFITTIIAQNSGVSINEDGTNNHHSAILDLKTTSQGFLFPRMTESQRDLIANPALGLFIFQIDGDVGLYFYDGNAWVLGVGSSGSTVVNQVGDFSYGGVIIWVDPQDNSKGFVCAIEDQSTDAEYGCGFLVIPGADGLGLGDGAQNTTDIIANNCLPNNSSVLVAADLCEAYTITVDGIIYDDWHLPSRDELDQMYQNLTVIELTANANGGSDFANMAYWTSTEYSNGNAYLQYFNSGGGQGNIHKWARNAVRAVRAF